MISRIIFIEGPRNSGKSTAAQTLIALYQAKGYEAFTKEISAATDSASLAEDIKVVKHTKNVVMIYEMQRIRDWPIMTELGQPGIPVRHYSTHLEADWPGIQTIRVRGLQGRDSIDVTNAILAACVNAE